MNLQSTTILIVARIVSEPLRFLTRWFLSRWSHASQPKAQLWQTCPLMDLVNVEFSTIVRVLQYLASCLRADAPRLRLLWGDRSHEPFAEWVAQPSTADKLAMLRRALMTADTWTYERFFAEGMCWPWRAALLVDGRVAMSERRAVARELVAAPPDPLAIYFTRRLRRRVTAAEDLFRDDIQDALRRWAWSVRCGTSDTDRVRTRPKPSASARWAELRKPTSTLRRAWLSEEAKAKIATKRSASLPSVAGAASAPARATPKVRKLTPRAAFRANSFAQQKAWACKVNPATSETHVEIEAAYARLHPEDKRVHEVEAAMSSACEARCRMVAKAICKKVLESA